MTYKDFKTVVRHDRPVRILQFGEGNFLRGFADWMIDIANEKGITDTAVAIVSPRFSEGRGVGTLKAQNGFYHVILEGIANGKPVREKRLITCVSAVLAPSVDADMEAYRRIILSPDLEVVISNTTEAGIRYEADDVRSDRPATFPGKVTNLLWQRFNHFAGDSSKGLAFVCCELIEDNGTHLRECVLRHAREASLGEDFTEWVESSCVFADTLVDRIVSGFPKENADEIKASLGYDDNAITVGEFYHLWVIGGEGCETVSRLLPLDKAGLHVEFRKSVKECRDRKVRVLNGSHTGMVPVALQLGCETVSDAFDNPDVNRFIHTMVAGEVLPALDGDRDELREFAAGILERFGNPYIRHYLSSIALNSLSKWETRNWPTVLDNYVGTGRYAELEIFTFAALLAMYAPDTRFELQDNPDHIGLIAASWDDNDPEGTVRRILEAGVFSENFDERVPGFASKAAAHLAAIRKDGMAAALKTILR